MPVGIDAAGLLLPVVLAVDDDDFARTLLQSVFANANIAIQTYVSAANLLEDADLHAPAVLLLDLSMPVVSGLDLQLILRKRGVRLPIVFLTGSSDVAMAVRAMRNGAVDFVEKPFVAPDLVQRVRHAYACYVAPAARPGPRGESANDRHLESLTAREREVYDLMILGMSSKAIAAELGGSYRTVEIHRSRVMAKTGAASLADLVRRAFAVDKTS